MLVMVEEMEEGMRASKQISLRAQSILCKVRHQQFVEYRIPEDKADNT